MPFFLAYLSCLLQMSMHVGLLARNFWSKHDSHLPKLSSINSVEDARTVESRMGQKKEIHRTVCSMNTAMAVGL